MQSHTDEKKVKRMDFKGATGLDDRTRYKNWRNRRHAAKNVSVVIHVDQQEAPFVILL
jgi:hypothetical protein